MVSCPQCGQAAPDDAKFCDRCGQGLAAAALVVSLTPLEPGVELKRGYRIVELLSQTSQENRYRAVRELDGKSERFQLRERVAPITEAGEETEPEPASSAT